MNWPCKFCFISLLFLCCCALFGDPAAHIPACADAAVFVRYGRLKQIPALARLADSGEIDRLEKPAKALHIPLESFAAAFIGLDERLVLADVPDAETVYQALKEYYRGSSAWEIRLHSVEGMVAVTEYYYLPPRKPYHSRYDAVWVANHVAAFGDDDYPLPEKKLVPSDGKFCELSAPGVLASALIPDPSRFGFDVMGLAQQLRNVRLSATEVEGGILLSGSAEVRDGQFLEQTVQLFTSASRIFLVSFFGDDGELLETLLQKLEIKAVNGCLTFQSMLDAKTLLAIQSYYDRHAAQLKNTIKNSVQKTK